MPSRVLAVFLDAVSLMKLKLNSQNSRQIHGVGFQGGLGFVAEDGLDGEEAWSANSWIVGENRRAPDAYRQGQAECLSRYAARKKERLSCFSGR